MIIFKDEASDPDIEAAMSDVKEAGGQVQRKFDASFLRGFSASLPESYADKLQKAAQGGQHPKIEYLEADQAIHVAN